MGRVVQSAVTVEALRQALSSDVLDRLALHLTGSSDVPEVTIDCVLWTVIEADDTSRLSTDEEFVMTYQRTLGTTQDVTVTVSVMFSFDGDDGTLHTACGRELPVTVTPATEELTFLIERCGDRYAIVGPR